MVDRVRAWYCGTIVINPLKGLFSEIYTDKANVCKFETQVLTTPTYNVLSEKIFHAYFEGMRTASKVVATKTYFMKHLECYLIMYVLRKCYVNVETLKRAGFVACRN